MRSRRDDDQRCPAHGRAYVDGRCEWDFEIELRLDGDREKDLRAERELLERGMYSSIERLKAIRRELDGITMRRALRGSE